MDITRNSTGREVYEYIRDETMVRINQLFAENRAKGVKMKIREINSKAYGSVLTEVNAALSTLGAREEQRIRNEMHTHRIFHA